MYILKSGNPDEIVEARLVIKTMVKNAGTNFVSVNGVSFMGVVNVDIMNSESGKGQLLVINTENNHASLYFNPEQHNLTAYISYDGVTSLIVNVVDRAGENIDYNSRQSKNR